MNLPLVMVIAFLALTLIVGLYFSRKTTTLREYAVGNKQFATVTLVATTLASIYGGGGLVRTVECVHSFGLYWVLLSVIDSSGCFIISLLSLRMGPFMHHLSIAETISSVYGNLPRIIVSLSTILTSVASLSIQINVMTKALQMCVGMGEDKLLFITTCATSILIFYSAFGGIRAVTFTDVLQFLTFSLIIPLLAWFLFTKIGKPTAEIIPFLQNQPKFQFNSIFDSSLKFLSFFSLLLSFIIAFIDPSLMQRVYMSSGPIQAQKVFFYTGIFSVLISICIILVGVFSFIAAPELPIVAIWSHIMEGMSPIIAGLVSISLIAMAMSTADSCLNTCSVMVSHDIVESIKHIQLSATYSLKPMGILVRPIHLLIKGISSINPLHLARTVSLLIGIIAMSLSFYRKDLLDLLKLSLAFSVPIVTAPFLLAIYGFQGTSRTALIGMLTGILAILAWNQWIEPTTDIDGSFPCMLANGLAMLIAHYLLPQPKGSGWLPPDKTYQQKQQEKARIQRRRNKSILEAISHKKTFLATLQPSRHRLLWIGGYLSFTSLFTLLYYLNNPHFNGYHLIYPIIVLFISLSIILYGIFFDLHSYSSWVTGSYWLVALICCLPLYSIYNISHISCPLVMFFLAVIDFAILLWSFPFWTGIIAASPLFIIYVISACQVAALLLWPLAMTIGSFLGFGAILFGLMIYGKYILTQRESMNFYLRQQQAYKESYQLKQMAYALAMPASNAQSTLAKEGNILSEAIKNVTQSISFSDAHTIFYKEDFQSIIDKFSEWATYLKQRAKQQEHSLLQPSVIVLDELIDAIEEAYQKEEGQLPGLWVEKGTDAIPATLTGDKEQLVDLLVMAISQLRASSSLSHPLIALQFHPTHLQYPKSEAIEEGDPPTYMTFPALSIVLSMADTTSLSLFKISKMYGDPTKEVSQKYSNPLYHQTVSLKQQKMEAIVRSHYGHMQLPASAVIVCVVPRDVTQVREEMLSASYPRESSTEEEDFLSSQEQAESLTHLVAFHDCVCRIKAVEPAVISEILLLLRRCYGFKRHVSGQLFYVRTVGIASKVADWVGYHPKLIYAALLYDLVRYTRLPLSYIKANYNIGVFCFVENVLRIDSRKQLESSLLSIPNRFKEALQKEQLSVLYIKLAERLYDLEHAAGYSDPSVVKAMAKESLTIDVPLAKRYEEPAIAVALEKVAKEVLAYGKEQQ